jgi:hypothetical protein
MAGPGEELWQPASRGAEADELFDLHLAEVPQWRLLLVDPGEEADQTAQRRFDVPGSADGDVAGVVSAGAAQQRPPGVGAVSLRSSVRISE